MELDNKLLERLAPMTERETRRRMRLEEEQYPPNLLWDLQGWMYGHRAAVSLYAVAVPAWSYVGGRGGVMGILITIALFVLLVCVPWMYINRNAEGPPFWEKSRGVGFNVDGYNNHLARQKIDTAQIWVEELILRRRGGEPLASVLWLVVSQPGRPHSLRGIKVKSLV